MPEIRKLFPSSEKGYPTQVRFVGDRVFALGTNKRLTCVARDGGKPKGAAGTPAGALAISRDGSALVMGEATVSRFDTATITKAWGHKANFATCAAFSADARVIAYGSSQTGLTALDAETGKPTRTRFLPSAMSVRSLAYSADGAYLYAANALGCIDRFDVDGQNRVSSPREPSLDSIALSHDGRLLASGGQTWPAGEHPVTGKWPSSTHVVVRDRDLVQLRVLHVGDDRVVTSPMGTNGNVRRVVFVPGKSELVALYTRIDAVFLHRWNAEDGASISMETLPIAALDVDAAVDGTLAIAAKEGLFLWS